MEEVLVGVLRVSSGELLNCDVELVDEVVGASENELVENSVLVSGVEVSDDTCWNDEVVATNELVDVDCGVELDCWDVEEDDEDVVNMNVDDEVRENNPPVVELFSSALLSRDTVVL